MTGSTPGKGSRKRDRAAYDREPWGRMPGEEPDPADQPEPPRRYPSTPPSYTAPTSGYTPTARTPIYGPPAPATPAPAHQPPAEDHEPPAHAQPATPTAPAADRGHTQQPSAPPAADRGHARSQPLPMSPQQPPSAAPPSPAADRGYAQPQAPAQPPAPTSPPSSATPPAPAAPPSAAAPPASPQPVVEPTYPPPANYPQQPSPIDQTARPDYAAPTPPGTVPAEPSPIAPPQTTTPKPTSTPTEANADEDGPTTRVPASYIERDFTDPGYQPAAWSATSADHYPDTPYQGLGLTQRAEPAVGPAATEAADAAPRPERAAKSRRIRVGAIVGVAVLLLAVGTTALWFTTRDHQPTHPSAAPSSPTLTFSTSATPTAGTGVSDAYDVGTCFDEQGGTGPGQVELDPVQCAGNKAVFVINKVVPKAADCDATQGVNYLQHGFEAPDVTAGVTYCASLVVPPNQCFVLSDSQPVQRATCGSSPSVVRVLAVQTALDVTSACTNQTDPDVWFYQSPDSGQYACVSRPTAASTAPSTNPSTNPSTGPSTTPAG